MTELSREQVRSVAAEIDRLYNESDLPSGKYSDDEWLERFAAAIYSKGFAAGAEDMRERADDAWADAIQSDLENGVKWLNDGISKKFREQYPALAGLGETIRALPITPTNQGEQG